MIKVCTLCAEGCGVCVHAIGVEGDELMYVWVVVIESGYEVIKKK